MIRHQRAFSFILCFLGIAALATSVQAGDSIKLTPSHKAGQTAYIQLDRHIDQSIQMGGGSDDDDKDKAKGKDKGKGKDDGDDDKGSKPPPMKFDINQIYGLIRTNDSVGDAGAKYTMTYERVVQNLKSPMMEAQFDTDNPDDEDAAPMLGTLITPFVGMSLKIDVDKDRTVSSVKGMDAIAAKVKEAGAGNPMMQLVSGDLSNDRAKMTWGDSLFVLYPNKEVKVGDTWTKELSSNDQRFGKILIHYDCKLDHFGTQDGHKTAVVSFTTKTSTAGDKKKAKKDDDDGPGGSIEASSKGSAIFDIERGEFVEKLEEGKGKIKMTAPQALSVDQKMSSKLTVNPTSVRDAQKAELKKKAPAKKSEKPGKSKPGKKSDDNKKPSKDEDDE